MIVKKVKNMGVKNKLSPKARLPLGREALNRLRLAMELKIMDTITAAGRGQTEGIKGRRGKVRIPVPMMIMRKL